MSDFHKELEGKAYQLVNGTIDLEEFRSWYQLTMATRAAANPSEPAPEPPKRKDGEFSDYYNSPYEPMDDSMRAHHRKLMGEGDQ